MTVADGRQFSRATVSACRLIRTFDELNNEPISRYFAAYLGSSCRVHVAPFSTVGLGPDSNSLKDMDNLSQINPLACAGAGGAAGHANAVCVSACCEVAGTSVSYARDASEPSLSTLPLPVVARQNEYI